MQFMKISLKEKGLSTLGGRKIWFDDAVFRLNVDGRGTIPWRIQFG